MYQKLKGLDGPHPDKSQREKFFLPDQVGGILDAIQHDKESPAHVRVRDHALVYLAFYLGLRCGEVVILKKEHFRDVENGVAFIPTLKKSMRLSVVCDCGKKYRVSAARAGQRYPCPRCGEHNDVPQIPKNRSVSRSITPEIEIPILEDEVALYIQRYLMTLPPHQKYLFIGRPSKSGKRKELELPLSKRMAQRVLATYQERAEISNKFSFHALRHGRGVQLYDASKDLQLVKTCLRHDALATSEIYVHLSPDRLKGYSKELARRVLAAN